MASQYPSALRLYQQTGTAGELAGASPHKLIDLLLANALDRLASARGAMLRGELPLRVQQVNGVLAILEHLQLALDRDSGGSIAQNLSALYDYLQQRLVTANAAHDAAGLDEVAGLLRTLKSGWEAMPQARVTHH